MALNASGQISMGGATVGESINLELNLSATAQIGLNDSAVRTLAGIASGAIDLNTFKGKSNAIPFVFIGGGQFSSGVVNHAMAQFGRVPVYNGFAYPGGGYQTVRNLYKISLTDGSIPVNKYFFAQDTPSMYVPASCIDSSGNHYLISPIFPGSTWVIHKFDSSGNVVFEKSFRTQHASTY